MAVSSGFSRTYLTLHAVLLGLLWAASVWAYGDLPGRIPTHFDLTGTADAFNERSWFYWLLLPLLATFTAALTAGVAWMLPRKPEWINLPDRRAFEALSPEGQRQVGVLLAQLLYGLSLALLVLFAALQYGMYAVAVHATEGLPLGVMLVCGIVLGGTFFGSPFLIWWLQTRIQRLSRASDEAEMPEA